MPASSNSNDTILFGFTLGLVQDNENEPLEMVLDKALRVREETGCNAVEIWLERGPKCVTGCNMYPEEYDDAIFGKMQDFLSHFDYKGVHLPFIHNSYICPNPTVAQAARGQLNRGIELAGSLGCSYGVAHGRFREFPNISTEEIWSRFMDAFREFADFAQNHQMTFCAETCELLNSPERFHKVFADVDHPAFKLTLDAPKALHYCLSNPALLEYIRKACLNDEIGSTHLYDVKAPSGLVPEGETGIDFDGVLASLWESRYRGNYNLEGGRGYEEVKSSLDRIKRALQQVKERP